MGFKLKNVVKSVTKAAGQVAKVAVAPAAIVAASTLDSVGLRHAAGQVVDKTALNKSLAKTEKHVSTAAGWGIDAAGLTIAGVAAAPAISSAAGTVGHAALATGGLLKGVLKNGGGLLAGLFSKSPKAGTADNSGIVPSEGAGNALADAAKSLAGKVGKAAHAAASTAGTDLANKVKSGVQSRLARVPGVDAGPTVEAGVASLPAGLPWWAIPLAIAAMLLLAFIGREKRS